MLGTLAQRDAAEIVGRIGWISTESHTVVKLVIWRSDNRHSFPSPLDKLNNFTCMGGGTFLGWTAYPRTISLGGNVVLEYRWSYHTALPFYYAS